MKKRDYEFVAFYFDFLSPYSYLAHTQLKIICENSGTHILYRPVLMSELFRRNGGIPETLKPARAVEVTRDLQRFAKWYGVKLAIPDRELVPVEKAMQVAYSLQNEWEGAPFIENAFRKLWAEGKDLNEEKTLEETLKESGLNASEWLCKLTVSKLKLSLLRGTSEAIKKGVFKLPFFIHRDEKYFGNEALPLIAAALGEAPVYPPWKKAS